MKPEHFQGYSIEMTKHTFVIKMLLFTVYQHNGSISIPLHLPQLIY